MNLDLVLIKYAELRTVVDTYERVLQETASHRLSLEHFVSEEDVVSFQTRLFILDSTHTRIQVYIDETLKLDLKEIRELISRLKSNIEIYTNTFDDLFSVKEAFGLLKTGGHFDNDEDDLNQSEYVDEIARLDKVLSDVLNRLQSLIGEKE